MIKEMLLSIVLLIQSQWMTFDDARVANFEKTKTTIVVLGTTDCKLTTKVKEFIVENKSSDAILCFVDVAKEEATARKFGIFHVLPLTPEIHFLRRKEKIVISGHFSKEELLKELRKQ